MKLCRYLLTISMVVLMMGTSKVDASFARWMMPMGTIDPELKGLENKKDALEKKIAAAEVRKTKNVAKPDVVNTIQQEIDKYTKELTDVNVGMEKANARLKAAAAAVEAEKAASAGPAAAGTAAEVAAAEAAAKAALGAPAAGSLQDQRADVTKKLDEAQKKYEEGIKKGNIDFVVNMEKSIAIYKGQLAAINAKVAAQGATSAPLTPAELFTAGAATAPSGTVARKAPAVVPVVTPAPVAKPAVTTMPAPKEREEYLDTEGEVVFYPERKAEPTSDYATALLSVKNMKSITPSEVKAKIKASIRNPEEKKLYERFDRETKASIRGSILDNDSLPSANNKMVWADQFANVYESPYVMSKLTQAQKQVYADRINAFFANFDYDNMTNEQISNSLSNIEALYATLSPKLKRELQARALPYLVDSMKANAKGAEASDAKFEKKKQNIEQLEKEADRVEASGDAKGALALRQTIEKEKDEAVAIKQEAMSFAKKAAIGLAISTLIGGTAVAIDQYFLGGKGREAVTAVIQEGYGRLPTWEETKGGAKGLWGKLTWENAKSAGSSLVAAGKNIGWSAGTGAAIPAAMAKLTGGNVKDALLGGALAGATKGLSSEVAKGLGGSLYARVASEVAAEGLKEAVIAYALGSSIRQAMISGVIKGSGNAFIDETAKYAKSWMPTDTMIGAQGPFIVDQAVRAALAAPVAKLTGKAMSSAAYDYLAGVSGLAADKALEKYQALKAQGATDKVALQGARDEATSIGSSAAFGLENPELLQPGRQMGEAAGEAFKTWQAGVNAQPNVPGAPGFEAAGRTGEMVGGAVSTVYNATPAQRGEYIDARARELGGAVAGTVASTGEELGRMGKAVLGTSSEEAGAYLQGAARDMSNEDLLKAAGVGQ